MYVYFETHLYYVYACLGINKQILFKLTSRKCLYMTGIPLNMGKWPPDKHII